MTLASVRRRNRRRSAFTLLEVLVVMAIIVVLAGVASIYLFRYLDDSKKDKAYMDVKAIEIAVKAYALRNGGDYPEGLQQLIAPPDGSKPFLEGGQDALLDPWGKVYSYTVVQGGSESQPKIFTVAPDGTEINNLVKRK